MYNKSQGKFELSVHIAKQALAMFSDSQLHIIRLKHPDWIDDSGNLTSYRNQLASNASAANHKILQVLVGCDCIPDQSSVEHLRDYGVKSLWINIMKQSFLNWVKEVADSDETSKEIDRACRLLNVVNKYTDINVIDDYLSSLDTSTGRALSSEIAFNLDRIGLCRLVKFTDADAGGKKSVNTVFKVLEGLMNVIPDDSSSHMKKVENLINDVRNPEFDWRNQKRTSFLDDSSGRGLFGEYSEPLEYLGAVEDLLKHGRNSSEVKKLRSCDGFTLVFDVLGYQGERKQRSKSEEEVSGMPLEAVCQALWESMIDVAFDDELASPIVSINVSPANFVHNTPDKVVKSNEMGRDDDDYTLDTARK